MTNHRTKEEVGRIPLEEAYDCSSQYVDDLLKQKHAILGQAVNHLSNARGKGIRAMLLLQSAVGADKLVPVEACKAAAAVEIFHLATLVHDDVIDDAEMRRGIPSVQSKFGKKQAVIVGDYLLCLSLSTLSSVGNESLTSDHIDVLGRFVSMAGRICTGEYNQLIHNYNTNIGFKDYYKTISGKTAALFWIASYMGAAIGKETETEAKKVARFGQLVGLIFQIMDDCKDYELTEEEALKPVKSDLKEGVITLPLIFAMAKDKSLRSDVKRVFDGQFDVIGIIDKVKHSGGVEEAWDLSRKYFVKADQLLNKLENEVKKSVLKESLVQIFPALAN